MRRRLAGAALGLASLAASYAAFEALGGLLLRRALGREHAADVDHRLKPSRRRGINSDGIRGAREAHHFDEASYNVVFLGDSYTYGVYVPAEKAFPALVERLLAEARPGADVKAANFGWASSSPLLSLRLLRDLGSRYRPDLVVLCLDMTDFHDDLRYAALLEEADRRLSPTRFLLRRAGLERGLLSLASALGLRPPDAPPAERFFAVRRPLAESRPWLRDTERHVREIARFSRESLRADFLLFMLPRPFQYDARESPDNWERHEYDAHGPHRHEPFRWLEELDRRTAFPARSLLPAFLDSGVFPTAFRHDPHWNEAGHELAARAITETIVSLFAEGRLAEPAAR